MIKLLSILKKALPFLKEQVYATWISYLTVTDGETKAEALRYEVPSWSNGMGSTNRRGDYMLFMTPDTSTKIKAMRYHTAMSWWQAYVDVGARSAVLYRKFIKKTCYKKEYMEEEVRMKVFIRIVNLNG